MGDANYENFGDISDCTIEECAELIHALSKAKRFGWFSYHPYRTGPSNIEQVTIEIGDVERRLKKLRKYLNDEKRRGRADE